MACSIQRSWEVLTERKLKKWNAKERKGNNKRDVKEKKHVENETINRKEKEISLPIYVGFIDYKKAFDKVDRNKLRDKMVDRHFPQHLIRTLKRLCLNTQIIRASTGRRNNNPINKA
jgi:uncharacterized alpha-E superfamily protein